MNEYVDRETMISAVLSRYFPGMSGMKSEALRKIMENVPAADVEPVAHAEWQDAPPVLGRPFKTCSACGFYEMVDPCPTIRCPYCGAEMTARATDRTKPDI